MNTIKVGNIAETYARITAGMTASNYGHNLYSEREGELLIVYSYGKHHTLAIIEGNIAYMNPTRPSVTTAKHRNGLARELEDAGYTVKWVSNIAEMLQGDILGEPKELSSKEMKQERI